MTVRAVLFDADGVIQGRGLDYATRMASIGIASEQITKFLSDVFAAELLSLTGKREFTDDLSDVLSRWQCGGSVADALTVFTCIEVYSDILAIVRELRAAGKQTYLATNQPPYRANYMSENLGYESAFDTQFYSCRIGHAKPNAAYFLHILQIAGLEPQEALFIDDHEVNVLAAREVGLHAEVFVPAPSLDRTLAMRQLLARHRLVE